MDTRSLELLLAFHVSATKGSLHPLDEQKLQAFIIHVADQPDLTEDIVQETFTFLTTHPNRPWSDDLARDLVRQIRFGVELLRHDPKRYHR